MKTLHECVSSWYCTNYVICPICKCRAGYDVMYDSETKKVFKCKCNKGLKQIKDENA